MLCTYISNFVGSHEEWEKLMMKLPSHWNVSKKSDLQLKDTNLIIIMENKDDDVGEICCELLEIKSKTSALIWIWSTSNRNGSKEIYLKLGADGIIKDDLSREELFMIIDNSLKKLIEPILFSDGDFGFDDEGVVTIDSRNRCIITESKQEIQLTNNEYEVMEVLFHNAGQTVSYEEIFQAVWPNKKYSKGKYYRITNLIYHIRQKLESVRGDSKIIQTLSGQGYKLDI